MKNLLTTLVFLASIWPLSTIAQNTDATADRTGKGGDEFVSESRKIGNMPYANSRYPLVDINVLARKSRFLGSNAVYKDVFFDGKVGDDYYNGYLDESEIDDAIKALNYIKDSLLIRKPGDKLTYDKYFSHSDFKISAVFDPYSDAHIRNSWDVYIDLNKTGYPGFVHLKPEDILKVVQLFETAKDKMGTL